MNLDKDTTSRTYFVYSLVCYTLYYLFFQNNVIGDGIGLVAALLLIWGIITLGKEVKNHKLKQAYSMNFFSKLKSSNDKQKLIITVWIIASIWWGSSMANSSYDSSSAVVYIPFMLIVLGVPAFILYKLWSDRG